MLQLLSQASAECNPQPHSVQAFAAIRSYWSGLGSTAREPEVFYRGRG